jgi:hypothetical protein
VNPNETPQGGEQPRQPTNLSALRAAPGEGNLPQIAPGFGSLQAYELLMRQARMLANTTLVPEQYREVIIKYDYKGNIKSQTPNPSGLPNCALALNMATRMNADPIMVMQNLVLVEGKPSWSSQWVIAQINNCGRFEPLRFDLIERGHKTVTMEYTEWENNERMRRKRDVEIDDVECVAWTVRKGVVVPHGVITLEDAKKAGLPIIKGPKVSIEIAVKEGWYTKTGSKWQTMPELMLHYRSGAFFGRLYAPELLMGIPTQEEREDTRTPQMLQPNEDGTYGPAEPPAAPPPERTNVTDLRQPKATDKAEPAAETPAAQEQNSADAKPESGGAKEAAPPANENTGAAESSKPAAPAASDDMFGSTD